MGAGSAWVGGLGRGDTFMKAGGMGGGFFSFSIGLPSTCMRAVRLRGWGEGPSMQVLQQLEMQGCQGASWRVERSSNCAAARMRDCCKVGDGCRARSDLIGEHKADDAGMLSLHQVHDFVRHSGSAGVVTPACQILLRWLAHLSNAPY